MEGKKVAVALSGKLTKKFFDKAFKNRMSGKGTDAYFSAHETLEWAMYFAELAGYDEATAWFDNGVYPISTDRPS
jgi:hypothetical protein